MTDEQTTHTAGPRIPHSAGPCPVAENTRVNAWTNDGSFLDDINASCLDWKNDWGSSVYAYQILESAK